MVFAYLLALAAGIAGFCVSFYIWRKKSRQQVLVCPLHAQCDTVVHSEFSRFLGVPLEFMGMSYYGLVCVGYGSLLVFPSLTASLFAFFVFVFSSLAFLFSLYLTFIQAFYLRQWCSWCLISAALSVFIFMMAVTSSYALVIPVLAHSRSVLLIIHTLGFALGLGGATIADIFFFRFLRDLRISDWEARVLRMLSEVIWVSLAVLVLSGVGLYLPEADRLNESSKFLVKAVVVSVVIVNGAFLNLFISPKLVHISFGKPHPTMSQELHRSRKIAFALGAVSFTSWYTAFILGSLRSVPLSFMALLGVYLVIVSVGVLGSQLIERILSRRVPPSPL